jgi:hypothetical protein
MKLTEMERNLHEKLYLAYLLHVESFDGKKFRRSYRECVHMLLVREEVDSPYMQWIYVFLGKGKWEEDILPMLTAILGLPRYAPKWNEDETTPFEVLMQNPEFASYYHNIVAFEDYIREKHRHLYETKIDLLRARGGY